MTWWCPKCQQNVLVERERTLPVESNYHSTTEHFAVYCGKCWNYLGDEQDVIQIFYEKEEEKC